MRSTDVAIVGAGLAGSMAGAMLERAGHDFTVIDPDQAYPWDFRCEKLDSSQIALLRRAGLADAVLPSATPIDHLWIARLGRVVRKRPNEQVGIYYDKLVNRFRGEFPEGRLTLGKVAAITTSTDRQTITLAGGEAISARLVVLATGPNHALRKSLGIARDVVSANHSVSIGFDMVPAGRPAFDFPGLTYFPYRLSDRIAYLTLFRIGDVMRANLFVYYDMRDPWIAAFRQAPQATSFDAMPGLRTILGDFEVTSPIRVRPIDLYETTGYRQAGIVLVGDAFSSSCPAAGTGCSKVFTDVERLCNLYIPAWLSTEGMDREKIEAFYDDPEKQATDVHSMKSAHWLRLVSTDKSLRGRARRLKEIAGGYGRSLLEQARAG